MKFDKKDLQKIAGYGLGAFLSLLGIKTVTRGVMDKEFDSALHTIFTDIYDENLWEAFSFTNRVGLQNIIENKLRATNQGLPLERPLGPSKKFPSLDDLMFSINEFYIMPTPLEAQVDTKVVIGKKAANPLTLPFPIMASPMAYGTALSKQAALALARGASKSGTAYNCGQGPYCPEIRAEASTYIYQYNRGSWNKDPQAMMDCAAIEIQFGQGAVAAVGNKLEAKHMDIELQKAFGLPPGKNAVTHSRQPEVQHPKDLTKLVERLKKDGGGVPIGAKIGTGKYLEADLDWLCNSGVDYIVIDGAEAATKGSVPLLQDDFGIPTIFSIDRAVNWLQKNNFKDRISLIASGKIRTPGDVLKACALGADACYMGSTLLLIVSHPATLAALPFEPPTQSIWYLGKYKNKLNVEKGSQMLHNFFQASKAEIEQGIKALGKTSLGEVNKNDLVSLNEMIAKACNIPMVYEPFHYDPDCKTLMKESNKGRKKLLARLSKNSLN